MSDTKDRILDAAEKLIAEKGFAATSLRNITSEAGVNLAAVNYHFGSKEALIASVFDRRINPLNERRLAALDALLERAEGSPLILEEILRSLIGPALGMRHDLGEAGDRFMRIVGQAHTDPDRSVRSAFMAQFKKIRERFIPACREALPDLPPEELEIRFYFVVGAMAHTLAWSKMASGLPEFKVFDMGVNELLDRLVGFAAAGMRAPVPVHNRGEAS